LFNDTYNLKDRLETVETGHAYLIANAFVLVVKDHAYNKANADDLRKALDDLALICVQEGITKLAMPKICCGRNGLLWRDVKKMIKEAFDSMKIQILICS
jgi:O-acetyl-ADP-ribose deacetylase (regulator of RNase III)